MGTILRRVSAAAAFVVVLSLGSSAALAGAHQSASASRLISYRLGNDPKQSILLTISTSGAGYIDDLSKPAKYHFTLSNQALGHLKTQVTNARIATLKRKYPQTSLIACGVQKQILKANGRTITVGSAASNPPPRLARLLKTLLGFVNHYDPVPVPTKSTRAHIAQRC